MKKSKILRELPKSDTEHEVANTAGRKAPAVVLEAGVPQSLSLKKKASSAKSNKAKHKTRSACHRGVRR